MLRRALGSEEDVFTVLPQRVGQPFFVSVSGIAHAGFNAFFASAHMRSRASGTNRKYAYALRVWANFLAKQGRDWDEASESDVSDFKFWRRTDSANPRRVSGATWAGDLAALTAFYGWAQRWLGGPQLFSRLATSEYRDPAAARGPSWAPASVRRQDVKWLSPGAVRLWMDVGLHGIDRSGRERTAWRPRSEDRDAAFVSGLYATGLRLQELASVLVAELNFPDDGRRYATHRLAAACGKGRRGHQYWIDRAGIDSIAHYLESARPAAIEAGRRRGLYRREDAWVLHDVSSTGRASLVSPSGVAHQSVRVDDMDPAFRLRLLVERDGAFEPAMLWLNEDGAPRPRHAWYRTFERANARVAAAGIERLRCHPHMLRHSFALRWYAVGRLLWESKSSGWDRERKTDFREQFGDVWTLVQTMLGHASVETTRNIYLEPFRALDVRLLLEYGQDAIDAEVLLHALSSDARVRMLTDAERGGR